ncbi:MAG TPA: Gfo/Idh/MocA family oxidoreductase [Candidatus Saccharimonadia bacterium]|nr:Gfo/Idh/MocA family oxidoreductase [Candidatus Saccharimonadia bacterium]
MNPRLSYSSRRRFLQQSVLVTGASVLGFPAIVSSKSPNGKLQVGIIGSGGRGASNLKEVAQLSDIVALCDVNEKNLEYAAASHPQARKYRDYRELHSKMDDIDAVVVSTTEHTHAFAILPALRAKKHVYSEKPLTRDVHEARVVMEEAKKADVTTQMGTQMHATANYHRVVELIQSGAIGQVGEVHVWVGRSWGMQTRAEAEKNDDLFVKAGLLDYIDKVPTTGLAVPPQVDWNLWIGPAPMREFHDIYLPGPRWYRYWDFANGTMSDLGSHWNDLPFWALKLDHPKTIEASGPPPHKEIAPANMTATWTYGKRGDLAPVTMHWYQGTAVPKPVKDGLVPATAKNGVLFIGEKGMLFADYGKHTLMPEEKFKGFTPPKPSIPDSPGHQREWIEAAMAGKKSSCDFSYSGLLTVANHLGGVAYRAGKKITWDHVAGKTDDEGANKLLTREYREGWKL